MVPTNHTPAVPSLHLLTETLSLRLSERLPAPLGPNPGDPMRRRRDGILRLRFQQG